MNQFGQFFRVQCFGSSHGPCVGVTIDAPAAGLVLSESDFEAALERRRGGKPGTTSRVETDRPIIVSGCLNGKTTGGPLTLLFENKNHRSEDYDGLTQIFRPGHADWAAEVKYKGFQEKAGGGIFSGRMTLTLVAAGVVARKQLLSSIWIRARVLEVGGMPVDSKDDAELQSLLRTCHQEGDSVGALVECVCEGVPAGWGEPFFNSVESVLAHAVFSIPGVRGIEFGDGFKATAMRGSEHNDPYVADGGRTQKNGAGGVNGGITNGNPIVFRVAFKPTSSIACPQQTWDEHRQQMTALQIGGRHDVCFALRTPVVVESVAAMVLMDFQCANECGNTCIR